MTVPDGVQGAAPAAPPVRDLDRRLVRGVAWMGVTKAVTQTFSWVSMLLVARLLAPSDYGIVTAAATSIGLIGLVTELGLGTAVVARTELSDDQLAQLAGVGVIGGLLAWAAAGLLSFVLPSLLRVPELKYILPVSGFVVAMAAISTVPMATMKRRMDFRAVSRVDFARALVASTTTLALAFYFRSYWALILAEVAAASVAVVLLIRGFGMRIRMPVWHEVAPALRFSRDVLVGRVAWYIYSNADFAIVGRVLGKQALGDYSMAWTLVTMPNEKIATLVFGVTPSIFARVRHDLPEFRRYVLLLLEALSTLLFPACIGMALVAPQLVQVAIGDQWTRSVPLVQTLAAFAMIRALKPITSQILVSRGHAVLTRRYSVIGALVLPVAFYIATRWGVIGVALVWPVVFPLLALVEFRAAARELELPYAAVGRALWPSVLGTVVMSATVLLARHLLTGGQWPTIVQLAILVSAGGLAYAGVMWFTARHRLVQLWKVIRQR